jgi:hypothetical protein
LLDYCQLRGQTLEPEGGSSRLHIAFVIQAHNFTVVEI